MAPTHKPEGYSTVSPYLVVDGASRTIEFLERVVDAVPLRRIDGENGRILHAEVRIGDSVVMLSDGDGGGPVPSHVHIYVPDVDATYRHALEAGATSLQEPVKRDDPDKRGGVRDAGGTSWWFATQVG